MSPEPWRSAYRDEQSPTDLLSAAIAFAFSIARSHDSLWAGDVDCCLPPVAAVAMHLLLRRRQWRIDAVGCDATCHRLSLCRAACGLSNGQVCAMDNAAIFRVDPWRSSEATVRGFAGDPTFGQGTPWDIAHLPSAQALVISRGSAGLVFVDSQTLAPQRLVSPLGTRRAYCGVAAVSDTALLFAYGSVVHLFFFEGPRAGQCCAVLNPTPGQESVTPRYIATWPGPAPHLVDVAMIAPNHMHLCFVRVDVGAGGAVAVAACDILKLPEPAVPAAVTVDPESKVVNVPLERELKAWGIAPLPNRSLLVAGDTVGDRLCVISSAGIVLRNVGHTALGLGSASYGCAMVATNGGPRLAAVPDYFNPSALHFFDVDDFLAVR